ncbi:MAG: helix-turn-helix transcriptional regulator [bacterium]|nr:helix-turn-helix transcriptional regulator [bacterium]
MLNFNNKKIRELRLKRGISQKDFATQMGIDKSTLNRIEQGRERNITVNRLALISHLLKTKNFNQFFT